MANGHHDSIPGFHETPSQDARTHTPPVDFSVAREDSHDEPMHDTLPVPTAQPPASSSPPPVEPEPAPEYTPNLSYVPVPVSEPIPVPAPAATSDESFNDELLAKYSAAQAEIERLRATLASMVASPPDELRRRNRTLSDDGASVVETDVATVLEDNHYHQQEGVPLQLVVIIALGVFITTYLFF